jgi:adenylate cyclase class 1
MKRVMKSFIRRTPVINKSTEPDYRVIKQRFFSLNQQRMRRAYADLRQSEKEFLDALPVLLHVNHPILPGYIDKEAPAGLPEYTPSSQGLSVLRKHFKSFSYKKRAYRRFDINALFMMGSTGTIAYSQESDFDIWVVHDSALSAKKLLKLQEKVNGIEQWANDKGVDANLFLVNPEAFRKGKNGILTKEGSGSAQHYLLLEEFYRTSVLIAGRYPLWWLVPAEEEKEYDQIAEDIKHKRLVNAREFVDLGGLNRIKADEFYGATLWLLYKSLDSPYKSILKIILMESYATEYPKINLLALSFKKRVYEEEEDINKIDPYLMMLEKVEAFLSKSNEPTRLELIRKSFYFKVNEKLSQNTKSNWRTDLMQDLVNRWGWHPTQLQRLDDRKEWKLNAVLEERKILIKEFMHTYRYLSLFAKTKSDSNAIRAADLHVLGRKLYAAFERKAGKIELVYKGIASNLYESHVSFHEFTNNEGKKYWIVFSGIVSEKNMSLSSPLKRAFSLIELIAWCFFNKLIDRRTIIAVISLNKDVSEKEVQLIIGHFSKTFSDSMLTTNSISDLQSSAKLVAVGSFINVGIDPFSDRIKHGHVLTSNQTDALKYGGQLENLTLSVDQVIITSWQEVLTFRYLGIDGLMQCLQDYFKWAKPSTGLTPIPVNASCFSSYRGTAISKRIETLFRDIISIFYGQACPQGARFILGVEWDYVVMWMDEDMLRYDYPGNKERLIEYLSRPKRSFYPIMFDSETLSKEVLPVIYKRNIEDVVQCFYQIKNKQVTIYILDEKGSLIVHTKPFYDVVGLFKEYQEFFESISERMALNSSEVQGDTIGFKEVLFYRVDRNGDAGYKLTQHSINHVVKPFGFLRLQAIVEKAESDEIVTLFCEEQEFSSLEFGEGVYNVVARFVLELRRNHEVYPIYITDIDLSAFVLSSKPEYAQTSQYLKYKNIIENRLLTELQSL